MICWYVYEDDFVRVYKIDLLLSPRIMSNILDTSILNLLFKSDYLEVASRMLKHGTALAFST